MVDDEDYEKLTVIVEPINKKNFLDNLKSGLNLNETINQDNVFVNLKIIKTWFFKGYKRENNFSNFYYKASHLLESDNKKNLIEHLKNGLSLEDAINQDNVLAILEEVKKWYRSGSRGNKKHQAFYQETEQFLNDYDLDKITSLNDGLFYFIDTKQDVKHNNKEVIKPKQTTMPKILPKINARNDRIKFNNSRISNASRNANNFILHLKEGMSVEEALNQKDVEWNRKDFKKFYNFGRLAIVYSGSDTTWLNFYYTVFNLIKFQNQQNIIKYLKNGLSLDEALIQDDVFCSLEDIKGWYELGFDGKYDLDGFYNEISPLLYAENKKNIIRYLKSGMDLHEIFNKVDIISNLKEFKQWYNEGFEGNEEHIDFYNEVSSILKPKWIESLKQATLKVGELKATMDAIGVYCNVGEFKKWHEESGESNPDIKYLYELNTQDEVVNILKNEFVSFDEIISQNTFNHSSDEIKQWYVLGSNGEKPYDEFYNVINKLISENRMEITKRKVIRLVRQTGSLEEVLENNVFDYSSEEIMEWYDEGGYSKVHGEFRRRIDAIIGVDKGIKRNAGGYVKY